MDFDSNSKSFHNFLALKKLDISGKIKVDRENETTEKELIPMPRKIHLARANIGAGIHVYKFYQPMALY